MLVRIVEEDFKTVCVRIWDMIQKEILLSFVMIAHICYQKPWFFIIGQTQNPKKLYFASLESFEDIFEGAKCTLERKEKWDAFYLDFFREAIQTAPGMKPEDLTDEYIEENTTRLLSELNASGNARRKHTFISCWHCNESESEAMWKLYSTNVNNALAIQTTYQQLYEALDKDPAIEIGKVKYIDFSKRFSSANAADSTRSRGNLMGRSCGLR